MSDYKYKIKRENQQKKRKKNNPNQISVSANITTYYMLGPNSFHLFIDSLLGSMPAIELERRNINTMFLKIILKKTT